MTWTDISVFAAHPKSSLDDASLLEALSRAGVGKAWIFGGDAATTHDFEAANVRTLALAEKHPDRLIPIGVINPFDVEADTARWLRRGMKGFRVLTNWGNWISINNVREFIVPLAGMLHDARLPLVIALEGFSPMTGGSVSLPLIVRRACPDACLVLDHCWSPLAWEDYLAFADEFPDVWMTLHGLPQMVLRRALGRLGTRRILAGSWFPETDPDLVFMQIERAAGKGVRLDEILTANATRAMAGLGAEHA